MARKKKVARKKKFAVKHPFFTERNMTEAWTVVRIDDYTVNPTTNVNGLYHRPTQIDERRGTSIWHSRDAAIGAAQWASKKWPDRVYGVYQMMYVVQSVKPPVEVKEVSNGR